MGVGAVAWGWKGAKAAASSAAAADADAQLGLEGVEEEPPLLTALQALAFVWSESSEHVGSEAAAGACK
jgi:hypothetical protein